MNDFSLKTDDTIGVCAPSSYVERADIESGVKVLEDRGYQVFVHPQTYARHHQSAGTHQEKIKALHDLYTDPAIKLIWAAGGGNRALHIVDMLDYDVIRANPKPLVGFSDVTALLNAITVKTGIINYHGPVVKKLARYQEMEALAALLHGEHAPYSFDDAHLVRTGSAKGKLFGGNLSLFQYIPQTLGRDFLKGTILFLEDCNEELSRIDRMLMHLRRLGAFEEISGLVLGEFTNVKDSATPFGFTLEDIFREHTDGLDIPVIMSAPFGHGAKLWPLPIGQKATLMCDHSRCQLAIVS